MLLCGHDNQDWDGTVETRLQDVLNQESLPLRSQDFMKVAGDYINPIPFRDRVDELAVVIEPVADRQRTNSLNGQSSEQQRIYTL
jgi:hypothetical protein